MKIHEYQAKSLLKQYGVPVPEGQVASTPAEVKAVAEQLGRKVVIKGQVHSGGRGKAGAVKLASTPADAEDLTQEIFLELYRGIGAFRGESALSTWVYRVAVNRCLRWVQRERRPDSAELNEETQAFADWRSDPAHLAANRELGEQVQDALHCLSPGHQDVVVLCEMHGLTYKECAAALDIPVGTVKSRLSNAFRKMRGLLREYVSESCAADGPVLLERIP